MKNNLLINRGYLLKKLQYEIFDALVEYMTNNKLNQTKLAEKLNVSKGYVSQIMNANFDHKLSKLVDLSIAVGKVPSIHLEDYDQYLSRKAFEALSASQMKESKTNDKSNARVILINNYVKMPYKDGGQQVSIQA